MGRLPRPGPGKRGKSLHICPCAGGMTVPELSLERSLCEPHSQLWSLLGARGPEDMSEGLALSWTLGSNEGTLRVVVTALCWTRTKVQHLLCGGRAITQTSCVSSSDCPPDRGAGDLGLH